MYIFYICITLAISVQITLNSSMKSNKSDKENSNKAIAVKGKDGDTPSRIIAKGDGLLAEKMLDIAFAQGIKVRKDSDLTDLLDAFDIESPIPLEALHAVSLILERVYAENTIMKEKNDAQKKVE